MGSCGAVESTAAYFGEYIMSNRVLFIVNGEESLQEVLELRNHQTFISGTADILQAVSAHQPDVVVIDGNGVPSGGLDACRSLRAVSNVPILVVATQMDEIDELLAYALGADDCMIGPVSPRRFQAKLTALARRHAAAAPEIEQNRLQQGCLSLDLDARTVVVEDQLIGLTRTEFDILALLMRNPEHVMERRVIVQQVWPDWYGDDRVVEVHISRLRKKITEAGGPRIAESVRGVGYRLGIRQPAA